MILTRNGVTFSKEDVVPITSNNNIKCDKTIPCKCNEYLEKVEEEEEELIEESKKVEVCL